MRFVQYESLIYGLVLIVTSQTLRVHGNEKRADFMLRSARLRFLLMFAAIPEAVRTLARCHEDYLELEIVMRRVVAPYSVCIR